LAPGEFGIAFTGPRSSTATGRIVTTFRWAAGEQYSDSKLCTEAALAQL
jgi:hypothetical protein